jgi:hypothetical protein
MNAFYISRLKIEKPIAFRTVYSIGQIYNLCSIVSDPLRILLRGFVVERGELLLRSVRLA